MSDFYIGEIRLFGFGFAPEDWHICDGTLLQIQQNAALYSLLGVQFGGDGKTTFALPDFRGRVPVGQATNIATIPVGLTRYRPGNTGGSENVALGQTQVPAHNHQFYVNTTDGAANTPGTAAVTTPPKPATHNYLSSSGNDLFEKVKHNVYGPFTTPTALAADSISNAGDSASHNNMQPSVVMNFCIATQGLYPQRT